MESVSKENMKNLRMISNLRVSGEPVTLKLKSVHCGKSRNRYNIGERGVSYGKRRY